MERLVGDRRWQRSIRVNAQWRSALPFDDEAADHYADILIAREKARRPISMADAQIAAICRASVATGATRNTKDFAHTGVELVNPWTA